VLADQDFRGRRRRPKAVALETDDARDRAHRDGQFRKALDRFFAQRER
jgi:hypothetical protein